MPVHLNLGLSLPGAGPDPAGGQHAPRSGAAGGYRGQTTRRPLLRPLLWRLLRRLPWRHSTELGP